MEINMETITTSRILHVYLQPVTFCAFSQLPDRHVVVCTKSIGEIEWQLNGAQHFPPFAVQPDIKRVAAHYTSFKQNYTRHRPLIGNSVLSNFSAKPLCATAQMRRLQPHTRHLGLLPVQSSSCDQHVNLPPPPALFQSASHSRQVISETTNYI